MLRLVKSRVLGQKRFDLYEAGQAGDELSLHSHTFNHLTRVSHGRCEIYDGEGKSVTRTRADGPIEYVAGRRHAIRALVDGTRFLNISPVLGLEVGGAASATKSDLVRVEDDFQNLGFVHTLKSRQVA